jgi:hypothetical protein
MSDTGPNGITDPTTGSIWDCWPGYYCQEGQKTPNPSSGRCNYGYFCPSGSSVEQSCQPGTYIDFRMAFDALQCKACPPGYLCETEALRTPEDLCPAGSYCEAGSFTGKLTIHWEICLYYF